MANDIDTASVLILPDLTRFDEETRHGIDDAFNGVEPAVRQLVDAVERIFQDMSQQVKSDFEDMKFYADSAFSQMATNAEEVGLKTAEDIQRGTDAAERAFDELRRKATADLEKVGVEAKAAGEKTHSGLSTFVGGAALLGGITAVGAGLEQLTSFGLKSAGQIEQLKISFDQLTGSVKAGDKQFQDLSNFAAATPFEMQDVTVAAQRFDAFSKSVGISQAQLIPFLTTIGNVVSVTGGGAQAFDSVSLAMGQIASRGKLTLDNLNQLSNALPGFSGTLAIANATGKTQAQVMDEISKGQISAADGIQYLLKGMQQFPGAAGAMEKQSQTLVGVFSTFHDVVAMNLAGSFASSIPAIKDALTQITPIIGDALKEVSPVIGDLLTSLLSLAGPLVSALADILTPLLDGLAQGLKLIGPVLQPLGQSLGAVAAALGPVLTMAGQLIAALGPALTPIIQALVPAINGLVVGIQPIITALLPIITTLGQIIGAILAPAMESLGKVFQIIGPPLGQLVTAIGTALSPLLQVLAPIVVTLVKALDPLWPVLGQLIVPITQLVVALTPLIALIAQLLVIAVDIAAPIIRLVANLLALLSAKAIAPLLMAIAKALTWVFKWLQPVADWLAKAGDWLNKLNWGKIGHEIGGAFADAWKAVAGFFSRLPGQIASWLVSVGSAIGNFFASLPGMIWHALQAIPGLLVRAVQDWFHAVFFALGFAIGSLIRYIETVPPMIFNIWKNLWLEGLHLWIAGINAVINFVMSLPHRIWAILIDAKNGALIIIHDMINGIIFWFTVMPGKVLGFIESMWNRAKALFREGVDAAVNFIRGLPGRAASGVSGLWSSMVNAIGDIIGNFRRMGVNIINGLIDGIKGAVGGAIKVVVSAMKSIYQGALSALGIHSPSKLFADIGKMTVAGYVQGVETHQPHAENAVMNMLAVPQTMTGGAYGASGGALFGPGSIQVHFNGVVPSQSQANAVGQQVGQGIASALLRRGVTDRPKKL